MIGKKLTQLRLVVITILMVFSNYFAFGQQWQTLSSMPSVRVQHASAAYNGKVYVINGTQDGVNSLSSLLVYDIQGNTWSTGTAPAGVATRGGDAVSDGNGTIYFATGIGTSQKTLFKYVISTDTWSEVTGSANKTAWNGAMVYTNGKLYYLGGEGTETVLNIYNISTSTWSTGASIPNGGGMMHTAAVVGDKIYMIGGTVSYTPGTQTVKVYDIPSNTWTVLASSANFPYNVYYNNAIGYDGNIYLTGGQNSGLNSGGTQYNYYYKFKTATNTWEALPNLPNGQGQHTLVELDSKIYSIGGQSAGANRNYVYMNVLANGGVVAANQTFCPEISPYDPAPFTSISGALGGSANFSYEWETSTDGTNWTTIVGATSLTYDVPNSDAISATTYYRRKATDVSSLVVYSNTITVKKLIPLSISTQPSTSSQTLCKGVAATSISVTALGNTLSYQWYSNTQNSNTGGTLIAGATSNSYNPLTTNASTNYYYCVVSDAAGCTPGSITSDVSGLITVNDIPSVTLGTIANIANSASTFQIPFGSLLNGANQYSVISGTTALAGFTAVNTATISGTSGNFIIPIPQNSASGTYDFIVSVKNSTTGCSSQNYGKTVSIANIPTVQATNIVLSNQTSTTATISWTNGNGAGRTVFIKSGNSGTANPVNNTTYTANASFSLGTQIGTTGWYCVYRGTGSSVNVTGLTTGTDYQIMVAEYNGTYSFNNTQSTNNPVTVQNLTVSPSTLSFTGCPNTSSNSQTFTVTTSNPNADISITAPSGFEISNSANGTYTSSLTIANTGTVTTTSVFVRMSASSVPPSNGSITVTSNNAASKTIALSGNMPTVRPFKQALNFDGATDKVSIPVSALNNLTNTFTIEAWVRVDPSVNVGASYMGIATKVVWAGSGLGYGLDIDGGKPRIFSGQGWSNWGGASAPNNITTNTWVHLAGTYDGSNFKVYVDGQLVATQASATGVSNNIQPLTIGSWPNENKYFKGDIDEVRVWNVTRTAAQILQNKDVELNGNESGLVSYYNFNQGTPSGTNTSVTSLPDATANGLTGTLNTFALTGSTSNWVVGGPLILNDPAMCINGTTTLSHTNSGGTWSTSDANIISIDQATNVATALAVGNATITYVYSVNGCSFTSTKEFTVAQTPAAPTVTATVNYCVNATATALTATATVGNTLQWYTAATGGSPIAVPTPSTTTVGTTPYFVSQKTIAAGCEGPRSTITVSINPNTTITTQPVAPSAVCLNASSNTISVTATGGSLTYQWYSNTTNSTTGATAITNETTNSYVVPTNVAATKYYYVSVLGTCGASVNSSIVSQVISASTFTTDVSSAAQNIAYGGTAVPLTVVSPGATSYQWYSTPTKPSLVDSFNGGTGWTSSTGSFQTFALYSGGNPAIHPDGYLRFAYISPSSIYRDFALDPTATTVSFSTEYASLDNNNDRGKIQLYFYNASNTQIGAVVQSADLTGTLAWQPIALSNTAIPSGATKVRVVFYQIQEYPYWAGNYGIAFRYPSVTTNVAINGTAISGETSATYTPSTTTPGALYYYVVASGGCSTVTSSLSGLITVAKANPTIGSMSAIAKTYGDAAFTLTAPTSNATGAFTYTSSNTAVATVSGSTVTIVGAGTANITATQAADANYNAGSVTAVLTVSKAARTLSSFANINKLTTDIPFALVAPISSGGTGAITYSSSSAAVATVLGSTVTIVGVGTSTITATQAADANYLAATISATLTVKLGDSDGDGVPDDVEIADGTNPNDPSSVKDSDGDGVPDYVEIGNGTNPNNPSDATDSNGNGLSDYYEARNVAPTNIALSTATINENNAAGASIANLIATDVNIGEAFTYALITGTGSTDNAGFTIAGSTLKAVNAFDFETKSSYSVRLKVTDKGGLTFEKVFVITVADINEAPTALTLTGTAVLENALSGTTVGTLSATDPDANNTFTYAFVSGTGATDNASFTITGATLKTSAVFDYETKNSYAVRVKVTDAGGLSFEKAITITVTDVNEAPTLAAITDRRVYNVSSSQIVNLSGITGGPETAQTTTTTVSTDKPTTFTSISVVGTQIQFTLAAGITTPQDVVVSVKVKDNGGVANGGVDTLVRTFKLGIDPLPVAAASPNLITLGATAQLSGAGANAINYTWVAVGGSGIVGSGANINVRPAGTTTYAVVVTNSFGYQATIPVLLTVIADYKLVPANIITPNGDGVNDKWVIPNIDMYPENEVKVFDKAGQVVYTKRGYNNEWDGSLNGKKLKEDAYLYIIKFNKDGVLPIRGYLTIVR